MLAQQGHTHVAGMTFRHAQRPAGQSWTLSVAMQTRPSSLALTSLGKVCSYSDRSQRGSAGAHHLLSSSLATTVHQTSLKMNLEQQIQKEHSRKLSTGLACLQRSCSQPWQLRAGSACVCRQSAGPCWRCWACPLPASSPQTPKQRASMQCSATRWALCHAASEKIKQERRCGKPLARRDSPGQRLCGSVASLYQCTHGSCKESAVCE